MKIFPDNSGSVDRIHTRIVWFELFLSCLEFGADGFLDCLEFGAEHHKKNGQETQEEDVGDSSSMVSEDRRMYAEDVEKDGVEEIKQFLIRVLATPVIWVLATPLIQFLATPLFRVLTTPLFRVLATPLIRFLVKTLNRVLATPLPTPALVLYRRLIFCSSINSLPMHTHFFLFIQKNLNT